MSAFETKIAQAVSDRTIPGAVLLAKDKSGTLNYTHVAGFSSIEPSAEVPLDLHAIFPLMSMTKLPTTIAVLQQVERGALSLDDDVTKHLPTLANAQVLLGFDASGAPKLEPRDRPITLRHLLTHSSGAGYDFMDPRIQQYFTAIGRDYTPQTGPMDSRFDFPLLFQPGEGWCYGTGLDWAGRLVEQLTGKSLEDVLQADVFIPVGARDITFFPHQYPELQGRMWKSLAARDPESGKVVHTPAMAKAEEECFGGQGLYADVGEYMKVLESVLRDDGRLLKRETTALMFRPQLEAKAKEALLANVKNPGWIVGDIPDTGEYDWGLGGLLVDGDSHGVRRRGALLWSGAFNLTWIIDREAGLAAIFASSAVPPGDAQFKALMKSWEEFIYPQAKA